MIKASQPAEEKTETDQPPASKESNEVTPTESKEELKCDDDESKEVNKSATTSSAAPVLAPPSILAASRNDLIKDIESHIEIIYECLDELNESGSSSMLNKTSSNEPISISSETSTLDTENTVKEATATDGDKADESIATTDES